MRVGVVYFSGTGNTWHIAQRYVQTILECGKRAELLRLEEVAREESYDSLAGYDLLGIGYPIHAWNAPRLVADFLKHLPRSKGQPVFLFITAGSMVGRAFDWARALLTERGYAVLHEARYYVSNDLFLAACTGRAVDGEISKRFAWLDMDVREAVAELLVGTERHVYSHNVLDFFLSHLLWRFYLLGAMRASLPHLQHTPGGPSGHLWPSLHPLLALPQPLPTPGDPARLADQGSGALSGPGVRGGRAGVCGVR